MRNDLPAEIRARDARATRAALLAAAMRRFTVLGFQRTTTRDIAASAGVNVSLINRYFGSKEGLLEAVVTESANTLDKLRDELPQGVLPGIVDHLGSDDWAEYGGEHPLLLLLRDEGDSDAVARLRRRALTGIVAYIAEQFQKEGHEDAEQDAELALALVVGVVTVRNALPKSRLGTADSDGLKQVVTDVLGRLASD